MFRAIRCSRANTGFFCQKKFGSSCIFPRREKGRRFWQWHRQSCFWRWKIIVYGRKCCFALCLIRKLPLSDTSRVRQRVSSKAKSFCPPHFLVPSRVNFVVTLIGIHMDSSIRNFFVSNFQKLLKESCLLVVMFVVYVEFKNHHLCWGSLHTVYLLVWLVWNAISHQILRMGFPLAQLGNIYRSPKPFQFNTNILVMLRFAKTFAECFEATWTQVNSQFRWMIAVKPETFIRW